MKVNVFTITPPMSNDSSIAVTGEVYGASEYPSRVLLKIEERHEEVDGSRSTVDDWPDIWTTSGKSLTVNRETEGVPHEH